jgi:aryl sulfotransferase
MIRIVLWTLGAVVGAYVLWTVYLAFILRWEDEHTVGLGYYGQGPAGRERFKRRLRFHARLLAPLLNVNSRLTKVDFRRARVVHRDVSFPSGSCDAASTARAVSYQPRPDDIFVVTQMKCGTTWMEHIVYQVLHRGAGDLVETGTALYAVAPWLEGRKSVPIEQAVTVGTERPSRIIKTHLPVQLCPWSAEARYIYVARHPVSCFASCVDFVATNVGAMAPAMPAYEEWFTSPELMWWGTWTGHVKGWWEKSRGAPNVLFVHFEDMKKDLPGMVRRVAAFLGVPPLGEAELAEAVRKTSFAYMQEHQGNFEMHPPHILQTSAELFVSGTADRHKDVPDETRRRVLAWAAAEMADSTYPLAQSYPDVAAARPRDGTAPPAPTI